MFNCKLKIKSNESKQHAAGYSSDDMTQAINLLNNTSILTSFVVLSTIISGAFEHQQQYDKEFVLSELFLYRANKVD